jgi:signal transduction histidine kinase
VEATVLQAMELTNQIMAYSGRGQIRAREYNLSDLVRDMADTLNVSVPRKVAISYRLADGLPALTGDPDLMRQAVTNLVQNAAESYPTREGEVVVAAELRHCDKAFLRDAYLNEGLPEGPCIVLEVKDHGCGMFPDVQARMFDPFYTTKIRARGLGLAMVMGVTRVQEGAIHVKSVPGQGTTICLLFPVKAAHNPRPA